MNKYTRLGNNTVLVFVGNMGSKLIGFLMLPFYTKWLSTADYGAFNLIAVYAGLLQGFVSLCISESVFIFPKGESKKTQQEFFSSGLFIISLNILFTGVIFFVLKKIIPNDSIAIKYIWVIFALTVATFVQTYVQQFARSIDKIKIYAYTGIVLTASIALLSFILIPKYKLNGFLTTQILSYFIAALFSVIFSKAYSFFSFFSIKKERYRTMLKYSLPLIPNSVMWWVISALSTPIMESHLGLEAIGIFSVANKFPGLLTTLFAVFAVSWQISVLEEYNKEGYKEFYNRILRIVFAGLVFLSFIIAVSSKLIVSVMADGGYFDAWKFIPILTMGVLFSSLSAFVGMIFSAVRKSRYYFYSSVWGALASIVLNLMLIPKFGLWGAAIAVVSSHAIMAFSRIYYSWQYVKITSLLSYVWMILMNIWLLFVIYFANNTFFKSINIVFIFLLFILTNKKLFIDLKLLVSVLKGKGLSK